MLSPAAKTLTLKQKAFFLLLTCVCLPLLLLAAIEFTAGFSGRCFPHRLFLPASKSSDQKVLRVNYQAGYRFFPGKMARKPLAEIMPAQKPKDRTRIFVLGESAARGEQLADFSFARMLEAVFNHNQPQKRVEIINTGIPAINSWVLSEFAREIVDYSPDLLIIYAGHNEFIGPYGPASVFGSSRGRISNLIGIWASSLNIAKYFRPQQLPPQLKKGWQGLEMFLQNVIPVGHPAIEICRSNWQANMQDIFILAEKHRIPVLWCNVPVNEADCPPFASDETRTSAETRAEIAAIASAAATQPLPDLAEKIWQLHQQAPDHALISYLCGRMMLEKNDKKAAGELLTMALNQDSFRIRITPSFNLAAREAAQRHGAIICDVRQKMLEYGGAVLSVTS
jgi:hypothetical protein